MFSLKQVKIHPFFLEEEHAFSKKRKFKMGTVKFVAASVTIAALGFVLFAGTSAEKKEASASAHADNAGEQRNTAHDSPTDRSKFYEDTPSKVTSVTSRQYTASQIVKRDDKASSPDALPMGTTIPAKLINTVLSADQDSPVIAEIVEDVFWQNSVLIPQGTKAIGQGNLDESTQRLRTRFHTLVYPDGSEHALDGLALQPDGSSGLPGNYHSGRLEKHSGKFLGDFVGGVAQGLKDKRAEGMAGLTHEPGSLKNGLLNGLADSAFDYAQSSAEDMKNTRAVLEVPKGSVFTIYLEKEYIR